MSETVKTRRFFHRPVQKPAHVRWLLVVGITLLHGAGAFYVSGLNRALGVVLAVIGGSSVVSYFAVRRRGAWPSRPWLLAVAVVLVSLVAYGGWLIVYSANDSPVTA